MLPGATIVAIASEARVDDDLRSLKDLDSNGLKEIEQFFVSYNRVREQRRKRTKASK